MGEKAPLTKGTSWAYKPLPAQERGELVLLDNVQFVYELALAEVELDVLGTKFLVANDRHHFMGSMPWLQASNNCFQLRN